MTLFGCRMTGPICTYIHTGIRISTLVYVYPHWYTYIHSGIRISTLVYVYPHWYTYIHSGIRISTLVYVGIITKKCFTEVKQYIWDVFMNILTFFLIIIIFICYIFFLTVMVIDSSNSFRIIKIKSIKTSRILCLNTFLENENS